MRDGGGQLMRRRFEVEQRLARQIAVIAGQRRRLSRIPFKEVPREKVKLPKRPEKNKIDPETGLKGRNFVPTVY